jgi:hypothetical protein
MHHFLLECFSAGLIESQIRWALGIALNVEVTPTNLVGPKDLIPQLVLRDGVPRASQDLSSKNHMNPAPSNCDTADNLFRGRKTQLRNQEESL